ncbi:hypothetical protein Emag_006620 [Eimeria magna]
MEPFTKVEVNLPVSETAQPGRDADLPLVQQEEPYQRSQRSRKRSADALLVTGYLAAVLLICLTLKGSLAQKKFRLVKDAPKGVLSPLFFHKAVVSDFPPASDPAESSTEEAVDQGAAEDSGESYDFPRIDDLKCAHESFELSSRSRVTIDSACFDACQARRKLSEVLGFLKQPVHNAIQSEMRKAAHISWYM